MFVLHEHKFHKRISSTTFGCKRVTTPSKVTRGSAEPQARPQLVGHSDRAAGLVEATQVSLTVLCKMTRKWSNDHFLLHTHDKALVNDYPDAVTSYAAFYKTQALPRPKPISIVSVERSAPVDDTFDS